MNNCVRILICYTLFDITFSPLICNTYAKFNIDLDKRVSEVDIKWNITVFIWCSPQKKNYIYTEKILVVWSRWQKLFDYIDLNVNISNWHHANSNDTHWDIDRIYRTRLVISIKFRVNRFYISSALTSTTDDSEQVILESYSCQYFSIFNCSDFFIYV